MTGHFASATIPEVSDKSFLSANYHSNHWYESGSWHELMLVGAAIKLDIFISLAQAAQGADALAKKLGLDKRATSLFLSALEEANYLIREGETYALTKPAMKMFGDKTSRAYLGWSVLHSWRLAQRWLTLPEVLATGAPVPGDRFSESVEGFVRAMDVYAAPTAEQAVNVCLSQAPLAASVLDIGGATGTISKAFADYGLTATLFDLPNVIDTIKDEISAAFPRIKPTGGDFNESLPKGPFDIVFLGNVTHIYGPEMNAALYKRVFDALAPGGLIAIQDYVRGRSPSAPGFGINMLVNTTSGGTWSIEQYTDWLTAAGFGDIQLLDLAARDQQIVLGAKMKGKRRVLQENAPNL